MATDREQVKQLFEAALECDPSERRAFLKGAFALDPSLRKEVESLIASHGDSDSFLEVLPMEELKALSLDTTTVTRQRAEETESTSREQIGPYRILSEIGHGGMGVVYEAEQERPVHRRVALKLIKWGMDTKSVIARFESERQALALMNHPNIASVYDAGATEQGRPYFAMELVRGEPITEYCDKNRLTIKERLDLFIQVCEGVQHAHQKGIIHRDIKPSNILITIQDDKPVPKIIDFGVAKATSQRLTERTVYTELGQLIGTPEYMSPEQAEMTGIDIDTRTDVYSLGVILYELLVGAQPFDATELRKAGFEGIRRIIRQEEPIRPSTKVHSLGKTTTDSAKSRRIEPQVWERELRGDLDWIVMKALEKDRTRRYGSPYELAADIGRHLRNEPVLASPPSTSYRLQKFVRRHRVGVTAAALVLVALLLGIIGTTLGLLESTRQRDAARKAQETAEFEAAKAKAINEFLQETLGSANPMRGMGREVTLLEALEGAVEKIEDSFGGQPEIEAEVRSNIGLTYLRLRRYDEAEPLLSRALEIRREVLGDTQADTVASMTGLGLLHLQQDDLDKAERLFREAIGSSRQLPTRERTAVAAPLLNLAGIAQRRGALDEAQSLFRQAEQIWREADDERSVAWTNSLLAGLLRQKGEYEEAEALYRDALAVFRRLEGDDHPLVAGSLHGLALVVSRAGSRKGGQTPAACEAALTLFEEAIEVFEKASDALSAAVVRRQLGECLLRLERVQEAEVQLLTAYETLRAQLGEEHAAAARAIKHLVDLYEAWGKPEKAAEYRAMLTKEES